MHLVFLASLPSLPIRDIDRISPYIVLFSERYVTDLLPLVSGNVAFVSTVFAPAGTDMEPHHLLQSELRPDTCKSEN